MFNNLSFENKQTSGESQAGNVSQSRSRIEEQRVSCASMLAWRACVANPRTKNPDFGGFDSSRFHVYIYIYMYIYIYIYT